MAAAVNVPSHADPRTRGWTLPLICLFIATIIIRLPVLGDPNYHPDETFYLLVGKTMQAGWVPYVDIWDRKPVGLFLIYRAIAALPGEGVIAYQLVAGLFAFATAAIIARIASRVATRDAAVMAGILYLAALEPLAGGGGQSPIFYNLCIALAVLLVLRIARAETGASVARDGMAAMCLCGLALTIKPTALFEGAFLGIALLVIVWRRHGPPARMFGLGAGFAIMGLFPTLLCLGYFSAIGHAEAYWFATVESVFGKPAQTSQSVVGHLRFLAPRLLPLLMVAGAGLMVVRQHGGPFLFLVGWLVAAMIGFVSVPNFFDHYALSLMVPVAVLCTPIIARSRIGTMVFGLLVAWSLFLSGWPNIARTARSTSGFTTAEKSIDQNLSGGCVFVFDGPPLLNRIDNDCRLTARLFPEHLNNEGEATATGVDAGQEVARILSQYPQLIVIGTTPVIRTPNQNTRKLVRDALHSHYHHVDTVTVEDEAQTRQIEIWARS